MRVSNIGLNYSAGLGSKPGYVQSSKVNMHHLKPPEHGFEQVCVCDLQLNLRPTKFVG